MTIIAIDPGLTGGVCIMGIAGGNPILAPLPFVGKELDIHALYSIIKKECIGYLTASVYIEQLGIRPRQAGVQTMIRNWQRIEDAAMLAGASMEIIAPKTWQRGIVPASAQGDRKKVIAAYCNYARKKYPNADLIPKGKRVIQDGLAAALCIADWAKQRVWNKGGRSC